MSAPTPAANGYPNEKLAAALAAAALGFRILPCRGKAATLTGWPEKASTDPDVIARMWRANPDANPAAVTGNGRFVLDIDAGHGGIESLAALEATHGPLPGSWR